MTDENKTTTTPPRVAGLVGSLSAVQAEYHLSIAIPNSVVQKITKQSDEEVASLLTALDSHGIMSMNPVSVLGGTDPGSVFAKGKLMAYEDAMSGIVRSNYRGWYGGEIKTSYQEMFNRHFVYTKPDFEPLSSISDTTLFIPAFTETGDLDPYLSSEEIISTDETFLYWDTESVRIEYNLLTRRIKLFFVNGRTLNCSRFDVTNCREIHHNLNLLIARHLEQKYKFCDITDKTTAYSQPNNHYSFKHAFDTVILETGINFGHFLVPLSLEDGEKTAQFHFQKYTLQATVNDNDTYKINILRKNATDNDIPQDNPVFNVYTLNKIMETYTWCPESKSFVINLATGDDN